MKRYPVYKDSGVEWLGEIPEQWEVIKIKWLVAIKITDGPHETPIFSETGYPFISAEAIQNNKIDFNRRRGNIDKELHRHYCKKCKPLKDDILMCKSGSTTGKVAIVDTDIEFSIWSPLALIRANKIIIIPKFLFYSMLEQSFQEQVQLSWSFGTQPNIGMGIIENLYLIVPPPEEQKAIAYFLDHKLEQIEQYIRNKQRLIELLNEQKTAIINRAVTKGINPNAPMKHSGIEWLGEIPAHWELKRAKYYLYEVDERSQTGTEELLSVSHITGVTPRSEKNITMFQAESYEGYKTCKIGDIVCNIMWAWMGALGISNYSGIVSSSYGVYRQITSENFSSAYLDYLIRTHTYIYEYNCRSKGIRLSRLRMYTEDFFDILLIKPPKEEQQKILNYIEIESDKIALAIAQIEKEIELIQEYRTTLISDAVTGKIDVRGFDNGSNSRNSPKLPELATM